MELKLKILGVLLNVKLLLKDPIFGRNDFTEEACGKMNRYSRKNTSCRELIYYQLSKLSPSERGLLVI